MNKIFRKTALVIGFVLLTANVYSQDPDFYIFLCLGQSNMEGQAPIETQDMSVDSRFKVLEAVNCSNLGKNKGSWYTATPPLCRCYTGLSPVDYFGRKLVANLPSNIRIGIISVAIAGCKIELFDKNNYQTYVATAPDWMLNIINEYGGNPYARLVEIAKLAQKDGVIKGILLHQGESNTGDNTWPSKVKGVYNNLLTDLNLKADSVPLLAGEVVNADQGGKCASMNSIIATLPQTIPNSYVISSIGCTAATDSIHFNAAGYRELGIRYGTKMLSILGYGPYLYLEPECASVGSNWERMADTQASNGKYVKIKSGFNSTSTPPTDTASAIYLPFTVNSDSTYHIYARLNCPTSDDDAFWVKIDNGQFVLFNGLTGNNWQWLKWSSQHLTKGDHILTIAYGEDGAKLDKISISYYDIAPTELGDIAKNICKIELTTPYKASTTKDGKFVEVRFNKPMENPLAQISGFKVLVNSINVSIDSIRLKAGSDTTMVVALSSHVKWGDAILLSYIAGFVKSKDGYGLVSFSNFNVVNIVPALALISAGTSTDGKIVCAVCNKRMSDPSAFLSSFRIYLNGNTSPYPLDSVRLKQENDSVIAVYLNKPVIKSDAIQIFHYTGSVTSKEGVKLPTYRFFNVTNNTIVTSNVDQKSNTFILYPNLTPDYLNFKGVSGSHWVSIYNTTGCLVFEKSLDVGNTPVNVSGLPEGAYFVIVHNMKGKNLKAKFIKIK